MSAPESRPDIESTLADAFTRRHAEQRPSLPSLVDVRRRAHRRSARRAATRAGAVVAAGVTAVAGGWATTRGSSSPSAVPAVPVAEMVLSTDVGVAVTTLSVEGLWQAVAAELGTTVEKLRALNPGVDFETAPVAGESIVFPGRSEAGPETSVRTFETTTTTTIADGSASTSVRVLDTTTTTTTTVPTGLGCSLTDAQVQELIEYVRTLPVPGEASPPPSPPPFIAGCPWPPQGWTSYEIAAGDYIAGVAAQFCTTVDEIVIGNGWADGVNRPLYPGDLIAVPADAC